MLRSIVRWTSALVAAAVLHLAVVMLVLLWPAPESIGGSGGGGGGGAVVIALGSGTGAPGIPGAVTPTEAEADGAEAATVSPPPRAPSVNPAEAVPEVAPAPPVEAVPPMAPEPPVAALPPEAQLVAELREPEPVAEPQAREIVPLEAQSVAVEPAPPTAVASLDLAPPVAPDVREAPPPEVETTRLDVMPPPPPTPQRAAAPRPPAPSQPPAQPVPAPQQTAAAAPAEQPAETAAGDSDGGGGPDGGPNRGSNAGGGDDGAGPGPAGGLPAAEIAAIQNNYFAILNAHLARHKEYPPHARSRSQEGVVMLYFAMDANGRITAARVERTSGHELLDQAAVDMAWRAQPLPPIPPELGRSSLELVVPVRFSLR